MRRIGYIVLVIVLFAACFLGSMAFVFYYFRDTGSIETVKDFEKALSAGDIQAGCSYISAEGIGSDIHQFCALLEAANRKKNLPVAKEVLYQASYMEHVLKQLSCDEKLSVVEDESVLGTDTAKVTYVLSQPSHSDFFPEDSVDIGVFFFYFLTTSYLRIHQCAQSTDCSVESIFAEELNEHKQLCKRKLQSFSQHVELVKEQGEWKILIKSYPPQMNVYIKRWSELVKDQISLLHMPPVSQD